MKDKAHLKPAGFISFILLVFAMETPAQSNTIPLELKTNQGALRASSVIWVESSGPVAPEFHYAKQIHIEANHSGFFFSKQDSLKNAEPTKIKKHISQKVYVHLLSELIKLDVLAMPFDSPPTMRVTGVSYNSFSIQVGNNKSRFYYLLKDLEKSEFKKKKEIIQTMKRIKL